MTDDSMTGSGPIAGRHQIDTAALTGWLERHVPGFQGPLTLEQFKGGQSNPTYKLITPQRSYVMRAKPGPAAKLLPSAHAIEREYRVLHALAATEVPVGEVICLCQDETVIGRAFYIMAFVDGRVLWQQSLPGMTPAERGSIYDEMNRVISCLAQGRLQGDRSRRLRQAGQLLRAADRPLEQAVPCLGDRADRGDEPPDRLAARPHSARRRDHHRARRFQARQHDLLARPSRRSSRCWTGSSRRSGTRWPTSRTTAWATTSRRSSSAALPVLTSRHSAFPAKRTTRQATAGGPAATESRTGTSTWRTTAFALLPSCRGS